MTVTAYGVCDDLMVSKDDASLVGGEWHSPLKRDSTGHVCGDHQAFAADDTWVNYPCGGVNLGQTIAPEQHQVHLSRHPPCAGGDPVMTAIINIAKPKKVMSLGFLMVMTVKTFYGCEYGSSLGDEGFSIGLIRSANVWLMVATL